MKRLLALAMAFVMTMSLATVAHAAYPDGAEVSLSEAVDVMTAVGVFKGDENGNFKPTANLDRAAAAKLIAYLDLGAKAAEALPALQVFSDVPATHWASKYIAYCANAGYVAGPGNGTFSPATPLTGYAFGKMVLCTLGYDASIESLTGANWTIAVAKLMQSNDIADGVDAAASANLTREQAAQYCFNALKADMVEYENKGSTIMINGAPISTGASKATKVTEKKNKYNNVDDGVQQLCEKLYGSDLKKLTSTSSDAFGAPAVGWKYKTAEVGTYADDSDAKYEGKVTKGTIYSLLGKDMVNDLGRTNGAVMEVYVDGEKKNDTAFVADSNWKNNSGAAFGTAKGTITDVYIDEDGANDGYAWITVVVKNTYLLQATADYNTKTEKLAYKVLNGSAKGGSLLAEDFAIAALKNEDYILYTYSKDSKKIESIQKAEVVSGKVNSYKSGDSVTIDGKKYEYSSQFAEIDGNAKSTNYTIGETATIVLDTQGNVIGIDSVKASSDDVVFVKKVVSNTFGDEFEAKIVTTEGKKLTVDVSKDSKDSRGEKISASNMNDFTGFMSFSLDGDEYELTASSKTGATSAATSHKFNKVYTLAGKTATSKTVYIVEDADGDVTLYTGVKNAPTSVTLKTAGSAYVAWNTDNELTYVYVNATGDVEESSSSNDQQVYVLKIKSGVSTDENKKKFYEVEALVDGEEKTLNVADGKTPLVVGKLYKTIKSDSNGYINAATEVNTGTTTKYAQISLTNVLDAFKYKDGVFTVNGTSYAVKTDMAFLVNTGGNNNAIMDDKGEDYELADGNTFKDLENAVEGYRITGTVYLVFSDNQSSDDAELVAAYVNVSSATDASNPS